MMNISDSTNGVPGFALLCNNAIVRHQGGLVAAPYAAVSLLSFQQQQSVLSISINLIVDFLVLNATLFFAYSNSQLLSGFQWYSSAEIPQLGKTAQSQASNDWLKRMYFRPFLRALDPGSLGADLFRGFAIAWDRGGGSRWLSCEELVAVQGFYSFKRAMSSPRNSTRRASTFRTWKG
jgi:hypothetical protein